MKILLSEIDERLPVEVNRSILADGVNGVMQFGDRNDYPQRIERLILGSVTGKAVTNAYAKFLTGMGFDGEINNIVVGFDSRGKQITIRGLLSMVAQSISFFNGAYIHVNLNQDMKVVNAQPLLFKNC